MSTPLKDRAIMESSVIASMPDNDDAAIVRRVLGGDHGAFELLMRRHNRRLYRLARAILGSPDDAEDVLQEVYIGAYRNLAQFRGDASLSTWLCRLTVNECLGRKRRNTRRERLAPLSTDPEVEMNATAGPEDEQPDRSLARAQLRALLEQQVERLPESFRAVFVLRAVEEMSVEETAASLGIPAETVRSRHFRAKGLLREGMTNEIGHVERDLFEFGGGRCDRVVARVLKRIEELEQGQREGAQ
jgi:RNA polymerase sigma-70 factor (ECF subfamily)